MGKPRQKLLFLYSALLLAGGLIGFLKAGSLPSLLLGSFSVCVLATCATQIEKGNPFWVYAAIIYLVLLDGFFTYRFLHSFRFFPSGLFAILNIVVIVFLIKKTRKSSN